MSKKLKFVFLELGVGWAVGIVMAKLFGITYLLLCVVLSVSIFDLCQAIYEKVKKNNKKEPQDLRG